MDSGPCAGKFSRNDLRREQGRLLPSFFQVLNVIGCPEFVMAHKTRKVALASPPCRRVLDLAPSTIAKLRTTRQQT